MSMLTAICNTITKLLLPAIFMQMIGFPDNSMPTDQMEDPFVMATTPPANFVYFNEDFSSRDPETFFAWIHPSYGLISNGVLLTRDEAVEQFRDVFYGSEAGSIVEANMAFNFGQLTGNNTFQADCWLEMKLSDNGSENWYRLHHQFVFKILGSEQWYLIQWEYIPPDVGVQMGYESMFNPDDVPDHFRDYIVDSGTTGTSLAGVSSWPLLVGSNYASEANLHPLTGLSPNGSQWSLAHAVSVNKPTILYFISILELWVAEQEVIDSQMLFLESLYDTYGYENLYIYGVSDDSLERLAWLVDQGYDEFAPLMDEDSMLHATLNIDVHPYIVVFDDQGTVVCLSKSFHPSSQQLLQDRIREVVARAGS